ncbi:MAG: AAA family ATPase [Treponema sp.]|nr:AAA family ATPase [Treponema sp.]
MESYFTVTENILKRFFFIFGLTKDRYCENNHIAINLDLLLYKHLKSISYKRIIFYSMDEQLYFYDTDSFDMTKRPNETLKENFVKPETAKKPEIKPNRLQGPIPGKFKPAANNSSQNQEAEQTSPAAKTKDGKLHFGRMDANMAFERIDHCVRDKENKGIKTAVIFTNADDFIKYFVEGIDRRVFDSFNQFDALGPDNHNIVIFIFPEGSQYDVIANYEGSFFIRKISETNTINIYPPALDEIRNTINYYRLIHGLKVDFKCLDTVCKRIARELCKRRRSLKWLMAELKKNIEKDFILDTNRCDEMFGKKDNETAMQKLNKLIGMECVKREIRVMESKSKSDGKTAAACDDYHSRILPPVSKEDVRLNMHYVITGNPGTGKTTAARLLGEIMYESGYLNSGHTVEVTRKDLVAGFVGQTALKTKEKIEEAMGGVLFIDEAYSLVEGGENDFGREAVTELVAAMTAKNGLFSLVVAGYPKQMAGFIDSNPGLARRFKKVIHIDDYSPDELLKIFYSNLNRNSMGEKYAISDKLSEMLSSFFENWHKSRDKNWGNAGNAEKLLADMSGSWWDRGGEKTASGEMILDLCDIPKDKKQFCKPSEESKEDAMIKLTKLTGLSSVKERIAQLQRRIRLKGGAEPGHYVFSGNPGTGKTTVARLLGDILREEGVLRRGHVVEVLREDLVAGFVGQTAIKTKAKLEEALDGIFFLDEAYSLVSGGENDFGRESINTILAFMENNRKQICVIFAGYTKNMEEFVQSNPGLTRRITATLSFDDYNTDELISILHNFAGDFVLNPEFIKKSKQIFNYWIKNKDRTFGNAGQVRNYFAECEDVLYERIFNEYESDIPEEVKKTLTGRDIPAKYLSITGDSA